MQKRTLFFSSLLLFTPTLVFGACSVTNLTRCLDSVCAINIGANPAARCQYCGNSAAGAPTKSNAMKSISAGASTKYIISDKELKGAPTDPGQRYAWGTKLCLERVSGCTTEDVDDNYDKLIEKSCTAAGISSEMAKLAKKANTAKTEKVCSDEITACVIDVKRCTADYRKCESESDFDKYFSECGVASPGCESFLAKIRTNIVSEKNTVSANAEKLFQSVITAYQNERKQKLASAQESCQNNKSREQCIERVCQNNMRNKCAEDYKYEKDNAALLCKFYDVACALLK